MLSSIPYILLDAARMGNTIEDAKLMNPTHDSLYRGRSEESLAVVAPYLFTFQHNLPFINWYMDNGWGDAWGILIKSTYPMQELHKHFRKFLILGTEDNQQLYFRFYDPRVLRIFLPTCDAAQLRDFFGPIDYFLMEDEDAGMAIRCWLENGLLRSQKIGLFDLVRDIPQSKQRENAQPLAVSQQPTVEANNAHNPMPPDVDLVIPQRTRVTTSSSGAENNRSGPTPQSDGIYNHPGNETNKSQLQPGAKPKPKWKMFDD